MTDQLVLIEGVRNDPPPCYSEVIDAMETVCGNQPEMADWDSDRLASDIWQFGNLSPEPEPEEVARCVRIYRERNQTSLRTGTHGH